MESIRLVLLSCHVVRHKEISLGIPESGPIRACRSRMLRERRKRSPAKGMSFSALNNKLELRKRDIMEIVKDIRDVAFVAIFIAVALAPRIISALHAAGKAS